MLKCPKCKHEANVLIVKKTGVKGCPDCASAAVMEPPDHPFGVFKLEGVEEDMIRKAVDAYPNHSVCARHLGITRATLYAKKTKYGIH